MTDDTPPDANRTGESTDSIGLAAAVSSVYKILGKKDAEGGTAILGHNTATSGASFGVEGVTDSVETDAAGVRGLSTASSGTTVATYGVHGISAADGTLQTDPAGVKGTGTGTGQNAGVLGVTESGDGRAAGVEAVATTGSASAIQASAEGGTGIEVTTGGDQAAAVWGRHTGAGGTDTDYGVLGETSTEVDGVAGVKGNDWVDSSNRTYGVLGETKSSGIGAAGVRGETSQGSGQTYGVEGETVSPEGDSAGVRGYADTSAVGVRAESSSGLGLAVTGTATAADASPSSASDHAAFVEDTSPVPSAVLGLRGGFAKGDSANSDALNFVTFYDVNDSAMGTIENDGSGGVGLTSGTADYAEFVPRADSEEAMDPADVVGIVDGEVTREASRADEAMVITDQPIVTGNSPGQDPESRRGYETVAFLGQVPVRVRGTVETGDLIVPSGEDDGTARSIPADEWTPGDGPIVGRAWAGTDEAGVDEVTVAVGLETGEALEPAVARQQERIADLERRLDARDERVEALEAETASLREENRELRDRLATLEAAVGTTGAPADD